MELPVGSYPLTANMIHFGRDSRSLTQRRRPAHDLHKRYLVGGAPGYRIYLMILLAVAALAASYPTSAGHDDGKETNVVMVACLVDREAPHRIDVVASSVNMTQNPIPNVSRNHSCSENLHKLLTTGFKIEEASLENLIFVFLLTREDDSSHKH